MNKKTQISSNSHEKLKALITKRRLERTQNVTNSQKKLAQIKTQLEQIKVMKEKENRFKPKLEVILEDFEPNSFNEELNEINTSLCGIDLNNEPNTHQNTNLFGRTRKNELQITKAQITNTWITEVPKKLYAEVETKLSYAELLEKATEVVLPKQAEQAQLIFLSESGEEESMIPS